MELIEIKRQLWADALDGGANCPCCGQFVKRYRRPINSAQSRCLIRLYHLNKTGPAYRHMSEIDPTRGGSIGLSTLAAWELVVTLENEDKTKKCSGLWRITEKGKQFVLNKIQIPSHVYLYNTEVLGFDETKQINIIKALGKHFNYTELMSA